MYAFIFAHASPRDPKNVTFHDLTFLKISTFHITNLTDMYVVQPCYYKMVSNVISKIYEYVFYLFFWTIPDKMSDCHVCYFIELQLCIFNGSLTAPHPYLIYLMVDYYTMQ